MTIFGCLNYYKYYNAKNKTKKGYNLINWQALKWNIEYRVCLKSMYNIAVKLCVKKVGILILYKTLGTNIILEYCRLLKII